MKKIVLVLILVAALLFFGCIRQPTQTTTSTFEATTTGTQSTTTPEAQVTTTREGASVKTVTIKNSAFDPPELKVKVGTVVKWVNEDSVVHKVVSDPRPIHINLPEFASNELGNGRSYIFTFAQTGTVAYHCQIHPSMKGKIIVED
ncbi:cupredoxin domain-containing protein [Candidatus Micrarchaeota archaeon]|nr:cupredoxin domain-containing protein [Candidatus Micrarchaeota archaeon]